MDKKPADGRRIEFNIVATTTPKLLAGEGSRHAVVIYSESASVRIGFSGSARGMLIAAGQGFTDNYSTGEWWAHTTSSSGTVSGFIVL